MMRALLADRFKLQSHTEQREMPNYAMRLAKPDGRLGDGIRKSSDDARGGFRANDGSLTTQANDNGGARKRADRLRRTSGR